MKAGRPTVSLPAFTTTMEAIGLPAGLSQAQLGLAIGVRFQQIQRYECAASKTSASRRWQIADALDVPISYFFEGLSATSANRRRPEAAE
jgi:transcriptional regulator with XRE-family HTH domain